MGRSGGGMGDAPMDPNLQPDDPNQQNAQNQQPLTQPAGTCQDNVDPFSSNKRWNDLLRRLDETEQAAYNRHTSPQAGGKEKKDSRMPARGHETMWFWHPAGPMGMLMNPGQLSESWFGRLEHSTLSLAAEVPAFVGTAVAEVFLAPFRPFVDNIPHPMPVVMGELWHEADRAWDGGWHDGIWGQNSESGPNSGD